jgi:prepilin-type N-terminal cleavage/methylation domain-containing protein
MRMKTAGPHRSGFTLIEIMIVVSIMAIVLMVGLPAFTRASQREGMRKAIYDVQEACKHARDQAILTGKTMELVIRAEEEAVLTVQPARDTRPTGETAAFPAWNDLEPARPAKPAKPFSVTLAYDIKIEIIDVNYYDHMQFSEARVRFHPNGTSDEFAIVFSDMKDTCLIWLDVVTALAEVETDPSKFIQRTRR